MKKNLLFLYDSKCPICKNYKNLISKSNNFYTIKYIDIRKESKEKSIISKKGYNLNEGLIIQYEDKIYQGKEALAILNKILSKKSLLVYLINKIAQIPGIYIIIKYIRKILLRIKRENKLK